MHVARITIAITCCFRVASLRHAGSHTSLASGGAHSEAVSAMPSVAPSDIAVFDEYLDQLLQVRHTLLQGGVPYLY